MMVTDPLVLQRPERPSVILAVVLAVLAALVVVGVLGFNRLRSLDVGAQEALSGIDVQLTRRADLVPNLVETVKGYAAHERTVLEDVTRARAGVQAATADADVRAKASADAALQGALGRLRVVAEAYPALQANQSFVELQRQLAETEDQIAYARTYYNDAAGRLNRLIVTFPWMLLVGPAGVAHREFYDAPAGQEAPPAVSF